MLSTPNTDYPLWYLQTSSYEYDTLCSYCIFPWFRRLKYQRYIFIYNFRKRTIRFKSITCRKITVPEKIKSDEFKDEFENFGDSDYSSSDSTSSEGRWSLNIHSIYLWKETPNWWSTVPTISTKRTTTFDLTPLNTTMDL
jgi:hypothetical protein